MSNAESSNVCRAGLETFRDKYTKCLSGDRTTGVPSNSNSALIVWITKIHQKAPTRQRRSCYVCIAIILFAHISMQVGQGQYPNLVRAPLRSLRLKPSARSRARGLVPQRGIRVDQVASKAGGDLSPWKKHLLRCSRPNFRTQNVQSRAPQRSPYAPLPRLKRVRPNRGPSRGRAHQGVEGRHCLGQRHGAHHLRSDPIGSHPWGCLVLRAPMFGELKRETHTKKGVIPLRYLSVPLHPSLCEGKHYPKRTHPHDW